MSVDYEVMSVPMKSIDVYSRRYIFDPIISKGKMRPGPRSSEEEIESFFAVSKWWRARVMQLREAGWEGAQGYKSTNLCNCLPWMVAVSARGRAAHFPCHQPYICPWCWAREKILFTYEKIKEALASCGMSWVKGKRDYPYKITGCRNTMVKGPGIDATDAFALICDYARRGRDRARRRIKGSMSAVMVTPARDECFHLSYGGIHISDADLPTEQKMVVRSPSDKNLARLAAYMYPYPRSLFSAPVDRVVEILKARKGFRLTDSVGVLHARRRETDDESSMHDR